MFGENYKGRRDLGASCPEGSVLGGNLHLQTYLNPPPPSTHKITPLDHGLQV